MSADEEQLDVVNNKGEVIDTLPRSAVHGDPSLMHMVVHVLVFNADGELLLQKRSMDKDVAPGKWDTSVGGHVNAGEPLAEAVIREMEEELGIDTSVPEFLYTYIHSNDFESERVHTYKCVHEGRVRFQEEEIDEVRAWSVDEIKAALGTGVLSDNFEHEFRTYLDYVNVK